MLQFSIFKYFVFLVIFIFLNICTEFNDGSKILVVYPPKLKSVFYTFDSITYSLASKNHTITVVSSEPFRKHQNIKQIFVEFNYNFAQFEFTAENSSWTTLKVAFKSSADINRAFFSDKGFQALILSDENFDMVITNDLPYNLALSVIEYRFQCPGVTIMNHGGSSHVFWLLGEPLNPAYCPETKTTNNDHMTFLERLKNVYNVLISICLTYLIGIPYNEKMLNSLVGELPFLNNRIPLTEIIQNKSLIITPADHHLDYSNPTSMIFRYISGISLRKSSALPKDYEDFISNAPEGVILISWGSLIVGKKIAACEQILLSVFNRMNKKVIWKSHNKDLYKMASANIMLTNWVPQQDILAHGNVNLFMTHGGILSFSEAIYYGIPMIVTPFFLDQFKNARKIETLCAGLILNHDNFSVESITWAVNEIITNSKYKIEAQKKSAAFRDRLVTPVNEAVFWIEYILKYGNILKSAASSLPLYKLFMFDIIGLILLMVFIILIFFKFIYRIIVLLKNKYLSISILKNKKLKEKMKLN